MKPAYKKYIAALAAPLFALSSSPRLLAHPYDGFNTPAVIVRNENMNFGNIAVPPVTAGTVTLSPTAVHTTGGIKLINIAGSAETADFTITGEPGYIFSVILPGPCTISDEEDHTMIVYDFTSNLQGSGILTTSGTQSIKVGATLKVAAKQPPGAYINTAEMQITINYN